MVVVFPLPCKPTSIKIAGLPVKFKSADSPPKSSVNSSLTILTKTSPGFKLLATSSPRAFSFTLFVNSFTTL